MKLNRKDIKTLKNIKKFCKKYTHCSDCPLGSNGDSCFFLLEAPCDLKIKNLTK